MPQDAVSLVSHLLTYSPGGRYNALQARAPRATRPRTLVRVRACAAAIAVVSADTAAVVTPQVCAHSFFDELRSTGLRLPNGQHCPPLFHFRSGELEARARPPARPPGRPSTRLLACPPGRPL